MEPIRPSRGKARGRPQVPTNQPGVSGLPNLPPQGIRGPRPLISQPIHSQQPLHSSQPLQTPVTGANILRPPRQMPPRPTGAPQPRAPRPLAPRPKISVDIATKQQDPMAGVRILLKFHIIYINLYAIFFFID